MRYVAIPADAPSSGQWDIWDNKRACTIFGEINESEAKVIEFALNTIVEGRIITKLIPPTECIDGPRYAGFFCQDYDGPTEGIKLNS